MAEPRRGTGAEPRRGTGADVLFAFLRQCSVNFIIVVFVVSQILRPCSAAGQSTNLALHKPATSSSSQDESRFKVEYATDGVSTGSNVMHTKSDPIPWLIVDLGQLRNVTDVVIFNRDIHGARLRKFSVYIGNKAANNFNYNDDKGHLKLCFHQENAEVENSMVIKQCSNKPLIGRLVYLIMKQAQPLHIKELEVYSCNTGYKGRKCQTNINDCGNNRCGTHGSCVDGVNRYTCKCHAGYTGSYCELDINDCGNNRCGSHGSCVDGVNSYTCRCQAGYTGSYCEQNINDCGNNRCGSHGSCVDGVNRYTCRCHAGYTGSYCEQNINDCWNNRCGTHGSCVDGVNRYTCRCNAGYTGAYCDQMGIMVWDKVHKKGAKERLLLDRNVSSCFRIPAVAQYPVYFKVSSINTQNMTIWYRSIKTCPKQLGGRLQEVVSSDGSQCTNAISIQETHCDVIRSSDHPEGATGCTYECKFDKKTPCSSTVHGVVWRLNWYLFLATNKEFQICEVEYLVD